MTKLTDTQLVVLGAAANREDRSILPLPSNLKGGAAAKVVDGLIRRGLAERIESKRPAVPDLVHITPAGLEAIGVEPAAAPQAPVCGRKAKVKGRAKAAPKGGRKRRAPAAEDEKAAKAPGPRAGTKQALLIEMLRRPKGATIEQIVKATGWQPHTVRGAIAGALKKKLGLTVTSEKPEGGLRVYRIAPAAD